MKRLQYQNNSYVSPGQQGFSWAKNMPSLRFYGEFLKQVLCSASKAQRGQYSREDWVASSMAMFKAMEQVGGIFNISGIENIRKVDGPVIFVGNHMSALETTILPLIIYPEKPVTFVVKQSLMDYPVFKHVVRSINPIAVSRTNPRADLKTVMEEGQKRVAAGESVIVFPQTTRSHEFSGKEMSSIGVKLAKKAGVPVIPIALKTDAWDNGKILKDFGAITPSKSTYFAFGEAMTIAGKGSEEQQHLCAFIEEKLASWK